MYQPTQNVQSRFQIKYTKFLIQVWVVPILSPPCERMGPSRKKHERLKTENHRAKVKA